MMTTSLWPRLTELRRSWTSSRGRPDRGWRAVADLGALSELKEQIRSALMSRIDPAVAVRIPRTALRAEITNLVSEIATEQRIQLNEIEEGHSPPS